jgi:hypothetical protein
MFRGVGKGPESLDPGGLKAAREMGREGPLPLRILSISAEVSYNREATSVPGGSGEHRAWIPRGEANRRPE